MNFNASRNVPQAGGLRKAKRVSDVNAMGSPAPSPGFAPGPAHAFGPGFAASSPARPQFQEGIQLDPNQGFGSPAPAGDFGYPAFPQTPISPSEITSMLHQPVVQDMALQYGNQLAQQGKEAVQRELGRFVPVSRLRYYFAVDTRYVLRKLMLIFFPFTHKEWMVKYDQDLPVQPRYDINAPDLYIPCMGYVTYVLLAGFMLGIQQRFSPEQIGIQASSALAYVVCELALYLVTLSVTRAGGGLKALDLLACAGYKHCPMIGALLAGLLLGRPGYYCALLYGSLALSYFLVQTLRIQVLAGSHVPEPQPAYGFGAGAYALPNPYAEQCVKLAGGGGTKRRVNFLLFVAVTQPLLSWWLTYHLVPPAALAVSPAGR